MEVAEGAPDEDPALIFQPAFVGSYAILISTCFGSYLGIIAAYIFLARRGVTLFIFRFLTSYFLSALRIEMSLVFDSSTWATNCKNFSYPASRMWRVSVIIYNVNYLQKRAKNK